MESLKQVRLERARRVQIVREMTKLSRRTFAKKTGIANTTLQHWEDGKKHTLPEKSVNRFIKALLNLGVHCSYEWLMHGEGSEPQYVSHITFQEEAAMFSSTGLSVQAGNDLIEAELSFFLSKNKDAVHLVLFDDAMEPRFAFGEIVAGIRRYKEKDMQALIGLDCIVLIQGGDIYLRRLLKGDIEGHYHLGYTNPKTTAAKPFFYNVRLVSAAPVIWSRRKL